MVEGAQEQQVVEDVGGREDAVDAGAESATQSLSSRSARFAMANLRSPTASAPRAGWSAATIISRPLSPTRGRRGRRAAASATASG